MDSDAAMQSAEEVLLLRARAASLETQLAEQEKASAEALLSSELRIAALRSGMIDLDGIKLIDPAALRPREDGTAAEPVQVLANLRREKPWLFAQATSSSVAKPPSSLVPRKKLATEMTMEEWRTARSELLRRQ